MTGDRLPVARDIASALGITQVFAEVTPHEKLARVIRMQQEGDVVAMVDLASYTECRREADIVLPDRRWYQRYHSLSFGGRRYCNEKRTTFGH